MDSRFVALLCSLNIDTFRKLKATQYTREVTYLSINGYEKSVLK